jgi:hypothetical protein
MIRHMIIGLLGVCCCLGVTLGLPGCGEPGEPAEEARSEGFEEGVDIYRVRGIIRQLPSEGPPPKDLKIQHEHIPEFRSADGTVHVNSDGVPGMRAMVMPFPLLAGDVSLEGLGVGDKIEFEFRVKWTESPSGASPEWLVSAIEPLPDDAEISFENKTVDGPEAPADGP